jgi:hypothetical protein
MEALNSKNQSLLQKCLDHGASVNKLIDEETYDSKKIMS